MDHASELEVVPLSSGIDDIDQLHKAQSHPFAAHLPSPQNKKKLPIVANLQSAIKNKLHHNKHVNHYNDDNHQHLNHHQSPNPPNKPINANENNLKTKSLSPINLSSSTSSAFRHWLKIIAPSIGFFGCQFAWACQGGYVDPYLRQLGLPDDMMNYAWILGPISGLIFQPMIGVFSDHCESTFGRRRPFFMAGAIILSICLFLFSHAKGIGNDIFTDPSSYSALVLAFICFWFLDFSTNFMEGPLRALCSDTLTEQEQLQSNSWFGIMNGLASTGGFALGYLTNDIKIIFGIAAFVVISTSLLTSYLVQEKPYIDMTHMNQLQEPVADESSDEELGSGNSNNSTDKNMDHNIGGVVVANNPNEEIISPDAITLPKDVNLNREITVIPSEVNNDLVSTRNRKNVCKEIGGALSEMIYGLRHMPSVVARCWIVQFCTYFSNFACWVYLTDYFGENIMGGDAREINRASGADDIVARQKYDLGVEYGNLAFMFIAGISAMFSLLATRLVNLCGLKRLWIICLSVYSIVMIISPIIKDLTTALFLFSFIGLPMGASFTLPWAVVSSYSAKKDPNNAGLWLSSLNIAECGPELTVGLLGGLIIDQFRDNVASVFFIAGLVNLISVFLVLKVDTSVTENDGKKGKYDVVDNENLDDEEEEELNEITPPEDDDSNRGDDDDDDEEDDLIQDHDDGV